MGRRTKQQIEHSINFCNLYLLSNNNDPYKSYDDSIKEHLLSGKSLPHYVIGIKDFIKASEQLKLTAFKNFNNSDAEKSQQEEKTVIIEKLTALTEDDYITIWNNAKNENLSQESKNILVTLWAYIQSSDFKNINWTEINVYKQLKII